MADVLKDFTDLSVTLTVRIRVFLVVTRSLEHAQHLSAFIAMAVVVSAMKPAVFV